MKPSKLALSTLVLLSGTSASHAFAVPPTTNFNTATAFITTNKKQQQQPLRMIKILDEITATLAGSKVSDSSSPSTSSRTTTTIPIPQQQPNEFPPQSVDELIPFNGKIYKFANVVNDGPFSWMVPYLSLIGFKEGNTLVNAIPTKTSSSGDTVIDKETLDALRIKAAEEFTNISPEERQRRNDSGTIAYYITALYAAYSAIILDDGFGLEGHLYKFLVVLPLFMARGLKLSAQYGL
mmetsp:Transcript_22229/g.31211  ORF Transcript_22229/g.31211 Transcript_22229/m.31211 type:complete len:237 (+) Transcript_22229:95-805(+)